MQRNIVVGLFAVVVAFGAGCKKKAADPATGSGSSLATGSDVGSGSATADSGSGSSGTSVTFTPPAHGPHHEKVGQWLEKFQGVLGDRWHGEKGEARKADTCKLVPQLETEATALAGLPPPEKIDTAKWSAGTKALGESVGTLKTACAGKELPAFETAFDGMHATLHDLVTQVGGHTEADGTHPHDGGGSAAAGSGSGSGSGGSGSATPK